MDNTEINEQVAAKLGASGKLQADYPLPYCTSIAAAWEIVEFVKNDFHVEIYCHDGKGWDAQFLAKRKATRLIHGSADTAPEAICLAFLKLT